MLRERQRSLTRPWTAALLSTALLIFGLFVSAVHPAAAQQITLLHVNDTHSHLAAWGPKDRNLDGTLGGLAKAATVIAAEKAKDPAALFVHAGDFMEGDFFFNEYFGVPELQILKQIGLDALIPGNHEFRFGPDFLVQVLQDAWGNSPVPILGTNLDPQGHALGSWITPTLIKEANGVKVGFFGLTPPDAAMENPDPVVIRDDINAVSQAAVNALIAGGAQVVVCLSHQCLDAARELASGVSGIDVIVNGHDHAVLKRPEAVDRPGGGATLIVSAGSHYRWVGRLRLFVEGGQVHFLNYRLLSVDGDVPPLPGVKLQIDNLEAGIVSWYGDVYHQQLSRATHEIGMEWDPEEADRDTPLGNLFTDAYRAWTGTDIAIEPFGYMGDPLPKGPIVGADVFRAMSYGNYRTSPRTFVRPWRLTTFQAIGADLVPVLEVLLYYGGDFFPQVSGLRFRYDSTAAFGHKILPETVYVGDQPIQTGSYYSFTVTEQIYGALAAVFQMPMQNVAVLPTYAVDAVRSFVDAQKKLDDRTSGRIVDVAALHKHGKNDHGCGDRR